MASMKRLMFFAPIIDVDCLLFSSLFIYLFIGYLFIQLLIHSFIYLLFVYFFAFAVFLFFVHWWADSTEIFLPAFIRIINFQSHSRAWQVDLNTTKKILWFLCDLTSSRIRGRIRGRYFSSPFCACVTGRLDTKSFRYKFFLSRCK